MSEKQDEYRIKQMNEKISEEKRTGGPAFPQRIYNHNPNTDGYVPALSQMGMTLLDHFAGLAMLGILASEKVAVPYEAIAEEAYMQANAMLAEREKRGKS